MRLFLPVILLLFWVMPAKAEITYVDMPWKRVLKLAAEQHKGIFIDCYTSWCGWCKTMEKETFVDGEVQQFINQHFVALKMDMEHGEGLQMAMKFHVTGYPVFLFFDSNGHFVYQVTGFMHAPAFMAEMRKSLLPEYQQAAPGYSTGIDIKYPTFFTATYDEPGKRKAPDQKEVITWLDGQKDLYSEESWAVLARFDGGEKYTWHILNNSELYKQLFGKYTVDAKLSEVLQQGLDYAISKKDREVLMMVTRLSDKLDTSIAFSARINMLVAYYSATNEWKSYADAVDTFVHRKGKANTGFMLARLKEIAEKCSDTATIMRSLQWMPNPSVLTTYDGLYSCGKIYFLLGDRKHASPLLEQALNVAKKEGRPTDELERMLAK